MKKTILSLLPLLFCMFIMAQQSTEKYVQADKNAVITINGKTFHQGDVVSKEALKKLFPNTVEVAATASDKPVKATSYRCVVSITSENGIWKFSTKESNGNPGRFAEIVEKAKSKDVVFIDDLKYAGSTSTTFPTQFSFVVE